MQPIAPNPIAPDPVADGPATASGRASAAARPSSRPEQLIRPPTSEHSPQGSSQDPVAAAPAKPRPRLVDDIVPATGDERAARLLLNHVVEPADVGIGRLLRRHGPVDVLAAIAAAELADLEPDPVRRKRLADRCGGLRLRLGREHVEAGLAAARSVGARFVVPGDALWPRALDDLDEQTPIGLWIVGSVPWAPRAPAAAVQIPLWRSDPDGTPVETPDDADVFDTAGADTAGHAAARGTSAGVAVVGARACTGYGSHVAGSLSADLSRVGVPVISGAALVRSQVTVVGQSRYDCHGGNWAGPAMLAGPQIRPGPSA